jgi:hypothetical protein
MMLDDIIDWLREYFWGIAGGAFITALIGIALATANGLAPSATKDLAGIIPSIQKVLDEVFGIVNKVSIFVSILSGIPIGLRLLYRKIFEE